MLLQYSFTSLEELAGYIKATPLNHLAHQFRTLPLVSRRLLNGVENLSFNLLHDKGYCYALGINYQEPNTVDENLGRLAAYLALTNNIPLCPL